VLPTTGKTLSGKTVTFVDTNAPDYNHADAITAVEASEAQEKPTTTEISKRQDGILDQWCCSTNCEWCSNSNCTNWICEVGAIVSS